MSCNKNGSCKLDSSMCKYAFACSLVVIPRATSIFVSIVESFKSFASWLTSSSSGRSICHLFLDCINAFTSSVLIIANVGGD